MRTVTLVAVAILAAFVLSGDARVPARGQTYLQVNLCGNACNNGGLGVVAGLERSIRARSPFAVTLNEVCENQFTSLRSDLGGYQGRFDPTGATCHNGTRYGNAILIRSGELELVGSWELPKPAGRESRRLLCVSAASHGVGSLVVCVTHISNVAGNIAAQVSAVAGILNGLDGGGAVLLGGDFNTDPADVRMDPLYACDGPFREADSEGCASRSAIDRVVGSDVINERTYGLHKYDYIFTAGAVWESMRADAMDAAAGLSDHNALWATAFIRPSAALSAQPAPPGSSRPAVRPAARASRG